MLPKVVQEVTALLNDGDVDYKILADNLQYSLVANSSCETALKSSSIRHGLCLYGRTNA